MNTPTITMDPTEAESRLKEYRAQLHRRADSEYEAVAKGYEALSEGTPLISLREVFAECPFDDKGRPRLAIARADRKQVKFEWQRGWHGGDWTRGPRAFFDASAPRATRKGDTLRIGVEFNEGILPDSRKTDGWSLIPMIPAKVRADHPSSYDRERFILWEVEEWADSRIGRPDPPSDPYLLEHLAGDLYVVLAEWDLTPLERAVVAGRSDA